VENLESRELTKSGHCQRERERSSNGKIQGLGSILAQGKSFGREKKKKDVNDREKPCLRKKGLKDWGGKRTFHVLTQGRVLA